MLDFIKAKIWYLCETDNASCQCINSSTRVREALQGYDADERYLKQRNNIKAAFGFILTADEAELDLRIKVIKLKVADWGDQSFESYEL